MAMTCNVICSSRTGNTALLAETVWETARELGWECAGPEKPREGGREDGDLIFAGFWTDKGDCSEEMASFLEGLEGKRVFLFGTAGFGGSQEYYERVLGRVKAHLAPSNRLAGTFMCQGKMPEAVGARFEAGLRQEPENEALKARLENFRQAMAHPDRRDLEALREAVKQALSAVSRS